MDFLRAINKLVAFLLELVMLAIFVYWGLQLNTATAVRILASIGSPALIIAVWAKWLAPRAEHRLQGRVLVGAKLSIFGLASVALWHAGRDTLGLGFMTACLINAAIDAEWKA